MKTLPAALTTHLGLGRTTLAHALRVTRTDGEVFAFTQAQDDATIDSVAYSASPGLDVTNIEITAGAAVGNLELTTLDDGEVFTAADLLGGVWKNASFVLIRYNHQSVSDGVDTLLAGTFGEIERRLGKVIVELLDLRQYLQQPVGMASSKTCRYRFGDPLTCRMDLTGSPGFIEQLTVTAKTGNGHFRCAAASASEHRYTNGLVEWVTGNNAGLTEQVKTFAFEGSPSQLWFTLALPMASAVQVGDVLLATAGCRKALEHCVAFGNQLNFGGEPHRPGLDELTQSPTVDV